MCQKYAELKSGSFWFHECIQPGSMRYAYVPKGEAALNWQICKWGLVYGGYSRFLRPTALAQFPDISHVGR